MAVSKRFIVTKDNITEAITYLEYEKIKGLDFKPKKDKELTDIINVEKMVIINPSLIKKLIDKKCKRSLEKIIKMTAVIYNEDDEDDGDADGNLNFVLGEIAKFRELLKNKYQEYMEEKEYKLLLKKLDIIENEIKLRKIALNMKQTKSYYEDKKSKGR